MIDPRDIAARLLEDDEDFDPKEFAMDQPVNYVLIFAGGAGNGDGYLADGHWSDQIEDALRFNTEEEALSAYRSDDPRLKAVPVYVTVND